MGVRDIDGRLCGEAVLGEKNHIPFRREAREIYSVFGFAGLFPGDHGSEPFQSRGQELLVEMRGFAAASRLRKLCP